MKCPVCSGEIPEGSWFCPECGTATPETPKVSAPAEAAPAEAASQEVPAKKKSFKLAAIIAAAAVVVILAVVIAALALVGRGGKKTAAGSYSPDALVCIADGVYSREGRVCEIEDIGVLGMSLDRSVLLIYSARDEELFVVTKAGSNRVSRKEILSCALSADGSRAVWIEDDGTLYCCDVRSGKTSKLAELDKNKNPTAVISPDGKTVLCSDRGDLYLITGGKPSELGDGGIPAGVSDGGKYAYFFKQTKNGYRFCVRKNGETVKLGDSEGKFTVVFNASLDEAVFSDTASGKTYISLRGTEPEKLTDFVPASVPDEPITRTVFTDGGAATVFARPTFVGTVYRAGNSLRVVTSELATEKIAGKVALSHTVSFGRAAAWITESGELWYLADSTAKKAEPVLLAEDIEDPKWVNVSPDGKLVYYENDDYELIAVTPKGEAVRVGDDCRSWPRFDPMTGELYFLSTGDTYKLSGTEKAKRVKTPEDFTSLMVDGGLIVAGSKNYDTYILSSDGTFIETD
ncbi:MAG: zinc ribbon domain-containing protein [Oscillospiraceae bacterium]|nr:zinc ribbon domain-containing protein [Oscillospiraceae bacterium]